MTFDPTKPVQTRGGTKARLLATDALGDQPIIALVTNARGEETPTAYYPTGRFYAMTTSLHDLVNVPAEQPFGDTVTAKALIALYREFVPANHLEATARAIAYVLNTARPNAVTEEDRVVLRQVYYVCKQSLLTNACTNTSEGDAK